MKRLILFLIRKYLGLKKNQVFQFVNQKSEYDMYWMGRDAIYKSHSIGQGYGHTITKSNVSLNWLLDDECEIKKMNVIIDYKED